VWWLLKTAVFVVLLVVLVLVAVSNDATVESVDLLVWQGENVRVFLVMFVSAIAGLACGLAFAAVRELQWRMHVSRNDREKGELKREVQHLRKAPLKGLDETPAVGDPARRSEGSVDRT